MDARMQFMVGLSKIYCVDGDP